MASTLPFRTSSDLVLGVLALLGVLAVGQSVDPEDFAAVNGDLDSIFRRIGALEVCYVPDPDNIPGEWFSDLTAIVAGECAMKFGAKPDTAGALINRGLGGFGNVPVGAGSAAQSLKIQLRGRPTGEPLRTVSF